MPDENDYRPGDSEVPILRKILNRLGELVGFGPPGDVTIGPVTLTASDIEIGAVELKDGSTDTRAKIRTDNPAPTDEGLVVRNIPSGTQDVSVTNFPATQPISAVSLPLPTGAATEATLATRLSESAFQARINTLGQKTMANSTPVAIASDQSTVPVSVASLPLPSGAATEATLATRASEATVATLLTEAEFEARINTQGQKPMATSTPVVVASDQSTIPISAASLPLPSGAATEATLATRASEATAATLLTEAEFEARINTQGQKPMANSTPVVIASDQSAIPVSGTVSVTEPVSVDDNGASLTVDESQVSTDNGGFTDGTTKVWPAGFIFDEVAGTALTENDVAAARIDSKRATIIAIEDATTRGQRLAVSAAGAASAILKPATSGGHTTFHLVSAGTTNATSVKGSAGQLYGWFIYNSNTSARKVAFHNTSGTPTAGASIFFSLVIPPSSGANVFSDIGIAFSSGIGITTVTGIADSDSAAVASNDLVINLFYS